MIDCGVVVHGGTGTSEKLSDGCKTACEAAFCLLERGKSSLDAAVEATRILEDDGRFNAGSGSILRIDGKTIEMDAAVMDSAGHLGIIINIRNMKNPILIARAVTETPHVALAGNGAEEFAVRLGFESFHYISEQSLKRHEKLKELIRENRLGEINPLWKRVDNSFLKRITSDTVGAVALDKKGVFAVATSTGGASPMMVGRVGDSPMIGCGFYAGASGAFATTGIGEEIIKQMLAKTVYDMVNQRIDIKTACEKGIGLFKPEINAGIIAISKKGYAITSNNSIAHYVMVREG